MKALSREIKFRAWNKELKRMIYSDDEHQKTRGWWGVVLLNKEEVGEEIMQFTGLLDKNGKEIFEGDLIIGPMYARNSFVMFDERYATFKAQSGTQLVHLGYECQVIGNIYESVLTKENK